jgi:two-component sensor histidine kinase
MRGHFAGALRGDSGNDEPFRIVRSDGTVSWGAISWQPIFDPAGRAVGYRSSVRDITQRKQVEEALRQSEQHIRTLLHEVNHRSKNLLMLVQAIAKRTAESRPEDFLARFVARIRSLVASQDLLLDSEWKCVQIEPLIRSQLAHLEDLFGTRIAIEGPSLSLTPSAAQSLGMAVHELATNASKYGALSNDAGRLSIVWMLHQRESGPRLEVTWTERDGPPVCAPTRRGFGTTVVSDMAKAAFNASVLLNYAPEGLTWRVECDAGRVLAPGWADPEP